jgi:hypothetical protein
MDQQRHDWPLLVLMSLISSNPGLAPAAIAALGKKRKKK